MDNERIDKEKEREEAIRFVARARCGRRVAALCLRARDSS